MNPHTQHRLTEQKAHYQSLIDGNNEALLPIEKALGKEYQQKILTRFKRYQELGIHKIAPTVLMSDLNWKGKSYFVKKALNELMAKGKIHGEKPQGYSYWLWEMTNA